eukprot:Rhum_TRINITY_DN18636_c0_g1::Rhum_TRINITY_DN18636_c0_g1_i1::g.167783::m.167783
MERQDLADPTGAEGTRLVANHDSLAFAAVGGATAKNARVNEAAEAGEEERWGSRRALQLSVNTVNAIFLASGLVVIVLGATVRGMDVVGLCTGCFHISNGAIALGVMMALFSGTACFVSRRRSAVVLLVYLVTLLLIVIGLLILTISVLVLDSNDYAIPDDAWSQRVAEGHTSSICNMQKELECSGWETCCGDPANSTEPCSWEPANCVASCWNEHVVGCRSKVYDSLGRHLVPFTLVMVLALALQFFGIYALYKLKRKPRQSSMYLELAE